MFVVNYVKDDPDNKLWQDIALCIYDDGKLVAYVKEQRATITKRRDAAAGCTVLDISLSVDASQAVA